MSKHLFELMREQEIQTSNFLPTKKEIENSGRLFAKQILSHGEIDKYELFSQAERLATELETTRRRVNALEYKLIPDLEETIKFITMKLAESERSTIVSVMRIKAMIEAQAA